MDRDLPHHAYPADLAAYVRQAWPSPIDLPPDEDFLTHVLSTAYQASLLREEDRPVAFRILLCSPDLLAAESGPPTGLHRVLFAEPRPFEIQELRRLAAAAPYHRALIGVCGIGDGPPRIWGVVYSGSRWLRVQTGSRISAPPLPPALVIRSGGAGRIEVSFGDEPIGALDGGRLGGRGLDVFTSRWLPLRFETVRNELRALHQEAREREGTYWAPLDDSLISNISQHMLKQLIAVVRSSHHGGTLLLLPPELSAEVFAPNPLLQVRYRLREEEPRGRFRSLLLRIMSRLTEIHGGPIAPRPVGWDDYRRSRNEGIAALDEAMFEVSHLIAGFAAVDGAVVMNKRFEILGFGAEIAGTLPDVPVIIRAHDLEAGEWTEDSTERVGTRHRSAYRLCNAVPDAIAIVVSQDGGVTFVSKMGERVCSWEYQPPGLDGV